jgi:hypothetical protein
MTCAIAPQNTPAPVNFLLSVRPLDNALERCNKFGMFSIAVAAAASLTAPVPTSNWFEWSDYPHYGVEPEQARVVGIRATVTPEGRTQFCEIERSSGRPEVDALTCKLTSERAKFRAASWTDGKPAWGVYRLAVTWAMIQGSSPAGSAGPDLVVTVNKLPAGVDGSATARVALAVDATGHLSACDAADPKQNGTLVKLACGQLREQFQAIPVRDHAGVPVASVQTARVDFVLPPEKKKKKRFRLF